MPERFQLSRQAGWRMPPNGKRVDRATKWGNPHVLMAVFDELARNAMAKPSSVLCRLDREGMLELAARVAVRRYRRDLLTGKLEVSLEDVRRELAGFDLGCWCSLKVSDCHASVLLEVANGATP